MNRTEINDMELTRQKWVNEGGTYFPISGNTVLLKTPGKGVFNVVKSQNPMDARLGLQKIADTFEFNFKIYERTNSTPCISQPSRVGPSLSPAKSQPHVALSK